MAQNEHTLSISLRDALSLRALATEWRAWLWIYGVAIVVYGGVVWAWGPAGIDISYLLSDTTSAARHVALDAPPADNTVMTNEDVFLAYPFYLGLVSNLGVLVMLGGAAAGLLGAHWARPSDDAGRDRKRMLFWLGILSAVIAVDDLLMFHDGFVPELLDIDGDYVFGLYGLAVVAFALRWRRSILRLHPWLLVHALFFFALTVLFDLVHLPLPQPGFFEEGTKFVGILSWAAFCLSSANAAFRENT